MSRLKKKRTKTEKALESANKGDTPDDYSLSDEDNTLENDNLKETELIIDDSEILPPEDLETSEPDEDLDDNLDLEIEPKTPGLVVSSALQRYLAELRKYPLMTREEEREEAVKAYEHGSIEARNKLVTSNLRLVVKIAMEYRRAYVQMLDLIQEGNAGLVQAVNRFNPYKGVKLSTYSAWWIRAYILKFLMDNKSLVRMGTTDAQRKLFFRLRKEAEKLYALTQKFDPKLLAEKIGVEASDVIEMQQRLSKNDVSLDTPVGDDTNTRQVDLYSSDEDDISDAYEKKQLIGILKREIAEIEKTLNPRDSFIFHNRIISDDPITLQEVGNKYGVSRERARQLETRVIEKIKQKLKTSGILEK